MPPTIAMLSFSANALDSYVSWDVDEVLDRIDPNQFTWISCEGLDNPEAIKRIIHYFQLSSSRLDQIFNKQLIDFDTEMEDCLFYNYRVLTRFTANKTFGIVSGSLIIAEKFLLTFEEVPSELFDRTRQKILAGKIAIKQHGVDYLLYLLFKEAVINNYYSILRTFSEQLDRLEEEVLSNSGTDRTYREIIQIRQTIKPLHRNILRVQEFISYLNEDTPRFINENTLQHFNQHLSRELDKLWKDYQEVRTWISELIEIQRDNINSNTNKVIDRLTVLSTFFLPLTFITGLYGMNFEYMPELKLRWGYPGAILVMATIVIILFTYMKRKKWIP